MLLPVFGSQSFAFNIRYFVIISCLWQSTLASYFIVIEIPNHCNVYFVVSDIFIVTLLLVDHKNAYTTSSVFIIHWSHFGVDTSARASDVGVQ